MKYEDLYLWVLLGLVFVVLPLALLGVTGARATAVSEAIKTGEVILGMSKAEVRSSWGEPDSITESLYYVAVPAEDESTTVFGSLVWRITHPYKTEPVPIKRETWDYRNPDREVVFENGQVASVTRLVR